MEGYESEYKRLNKEQRRAVDSTEGPLLVVAGPGTGKTQLLSMRVANILRKNDVAPSNILCL
ncbi:MAG TPA: UvrD-helicase domain-containing protein, partial [Candidatus Saccharimonadales bacterium]|nr:UvrD-helicase domain-containing protein [Candidatus Saccharimonadales bacterium]